MLSPRWTADLSQVFHGQRAAIHFELDLSKIRHVQWMAAWTTGAMTLNAGFLPLFGALGRLNSAMSHVADGRT